MTNNAITLIIENKVICIPLVLEVGFWESSVLVTKEYSHFIPTLERGQVFVVLCRTLNNSDLEFLV